MSNTSLLGSYGDNSGAGLMFRNRLINGSFVVAQRAPGATANTYTIDRWIVNHAGTALTWAQDNGGALPNGEYATKLFRLIGSTGNTDSNIGQRIEAINCADLSAKIVTASVWVLQTTGSAKNFSIGLAYANAADNWSGQTTIATSSVVSVPHNTWTQLTFTTTLPSTGVSNGLLVQINTGAITSNTHSVYLTNAQLEAGPTATPFERRPIGVELSLCQRYTWVQEVKSNNICAIGYRVFGSGIVQFSLRTPVPMRAIPTIVSASNYSIRAGSDGTIASNKSATLQASSTVENVMLWITDAAITADTFYGVSGTNLGATQYSVFSAEL